MVRLVALWWMTVHTTEPRALTAEDEVGEADGEAALDEPSHPLTMTEDARSDVTPQKNAFKRKRQDR